MLTDTHVRKINRMIEEELRNVNKFGASHEEKMEALERIAQLKSLLSPQPTRQDILSELASALQNARPSTPQSPSDIINDILDAFRR